MIIKYHDETGKTATKDIAATDRKLFDLVTELADYEIEAPCGGKGICGKCVGFIKVSEEHEKDFCDFEVGCQNKDDELTKICSGIRNFDKYHAVLLCKIPFELNGYIEEVILLERNVLSGAGTQEIAEKEKREISKFEKAAFEIIINIPKFDLNSTETMVEMITENARIYIEENIGRTVSLEINERIIPELIELINSKADKIYLTLVLLDEGEIAKYVVLRAADKKKKLLGLAVDIGTTTVCATVINIETDEIIGEKVFGNPQRKHGADVISRMQFELENGRDIQSREINDAIESACTELLNKDTEYSIDDIVFSVIAGNSVMQSIYNNIPTLSISKAPFTLPDRMGKTVLRDGLSVHAEFTEPLPASYVGGDITSGLSYIFAYENIEKGNTLFLDLGTNGEIALIKNNKEDDNTTKTIYLAATAAGPALEGANIEIGKPAVAGAVTRIKTDNNGEFLIKTVNDENPDGICGSGIISATATVLRTGLLTEYGRICDDGEAENEKYAEIYENYKNCIEEDDDGKLRINYDINGKIYLTEGDFRQIQTAKSAIAAGIETLLYVAEMTEKDINRVYIAGSFGAGIDVDDAKDIGLLPDIEAPVFAVGNTSAKGAIMYMCDKKVRQNVREIMKYSKYIELSSNPKFTEKFVDNMIFPQP